MSIAVDLSNLRAVCSGLLATDFAPEDRLKSILQVAYEILRASSIIAYKYDRATEQLQILAMPGVKQREMMRGPTPEPIFSWRDSDQHTMVAAVWLEDHRQYSRYLREVSTSTAKKSTPPGVLGFRDRELAKHEPKGPPWKGDLAVAHIRLWKGVGQTHDPVGQVFFNFYKSNRQKTFTAELKSAVQFVSTMLRELLIQQIYHSSPRGSYAELGASSSLRLLRTIDDSVSPLSLLSIPTQSTLQNDQRRILRNLIQVKLDHFEALERRHKSHHRLPAFRHAQNTLRTLDELVSSGRQSSHRLNVDQKRIFDDLTQEVSSAELWRRVCHAALTMVETYGGRADILLLIGGKLCRIIDPDAPQHDDDSGYCWLNENSITSYCIKSGKTFVCNNIPEKASRVFQTSFHLEPGEVRKYASLMVVPVSFDGEVRALLRLMSTDKDCFLDRHTLAVQDLAFVTSYALRVTDSRQSTGRISQGLIYFAKGQTVTHQPNLETLLREALHVLRADYAVFWPVDKSQPHMRRFGEGLLVEAFGEAQSRSLSINDPEQGVRRGGHTQTLLDFCEGSIGDLMFCFHLLTPGAPPARKATSANGPEITDFPPYAWQAFGIGSALPRWLRGKPETIDNLRTVQGEGPRLPTNRSVPMSPLAPPYKHSRIAFAVREEDGNVAGILWICFGKLHYLGWWERLYIRGLSNFISQAIRASDLSLAIRGFYHMIPSKCRSAISALTPDVSPRTIPIGGRPEPDMPADKIHKALDVLFMIQQKAYEVESLLSRGASFETASLASIFQKAWHVAKDLFGPINSDPSSGQSHPANVEQFTLTIHYATKDLADLQVNTALYTAVLNVLANAWEHGSPPYVVCATSMEHVLALYLGNGGDPPPQSRVFGLALGTKDDKAKKKRGVGLAVVRRILSLVGGSIELLATEEDARPYAHPSALSKCKTIFAITIQCENIGKPNRTTRKYEHTTHVL